ncbi:MAG: amidohydrolase [Oscillospiraceae bacterium]|nr:amidohydrolase [Oscillospiraceae bacterium]
MDFAVINANVIPMVGGVRAEAVFIKDGIIEAVGASAEIAELCRRHGLKAHDAAGATVLPAFYDCHVHMLTTGMNAMAADLYDCADIPSLIALLKETESALEDDSWVFGKRLDESRLAEGRPPLMSELDEIERPVFIIDRGKHYTLVNRAAFEALEVDPELKGVRRDEDGLLTGRLQDEANKYAQQKYFLSWTDEQRADAIRYTAALAASRGICTLHPQEGLDSSDDDVRLMLSIKDELPVDIEVFWNTPDVNNILEAGLKSWGGDILLDGSIGSRTAAFSQKYCDGDTSGYLNLSDEEVLRFVKTALENDLTISFHAIGELAITQALDAMERALKEMPEKAPGARLRLEHFGFPSERDIQRAGALKLRVSMQSAFTALRGGPGTVYRSRLGEERERGGYPSRRLLDAGCILGGGSDSDVTPMDSLFGIYAAVNQPYPENALTPFEAVRMYTIDAARLAFEDDIKGSLERGKQGNLVILEEDPMQTDPKKIKDIKVLKTVRRGEVVFSV